MDLYFKSGMYQEVLEAFEELRSKRLADTKFPRDPMVLATGACYKIVNKF
jgi:pentatricopeptide repeat protein